MRLKAAGGGNGIDTTHIKDDAINAAKIADDAVETAQIKDAAVTTAKLEPDAVDGTKIADDAIDETHLAGTLISGHAELTALPTTAQDLILVSDNGVLKKFDFMKWLPLPRAYSKITGHSSSPSLAGNYACSLASYANGSGGSTYTITLDNAMADLNYVVNVQIGHNVHWHDEDSTPSVQIDSDTQFRIHWHSDYKIYDLYFVVHGELSGGGY
tara:strand:- start:113 stop:751 length:639 start_codon:yes stop_codon:yes gene_type:complete